MSAVRRPTAARRASTMPLAHWPARWSAASVILWRDLRSMLLAPGLYVAATLGLLTIVLDMRNDLDAIARTRLLVLSDAFTRSFFVAALIVVFYLALATVTTVAREKEQGTLEVLFYGPVDQWAFVLGKHLAQVAGFLVVALGLALLLGVYAALTGLRLASAFPLAWLLSVAAAAAVTAAGVLCATLMRGVRAALALLIVISVALLALSLGSAQLSQVPVTNNASPLLFLRDLVVGLDQVIGYVSPISTFERGIDAAVRGDGLAWGGNLLLLVLHTAALLTLAVLALRRRGVRR